MSVLAKTIRNIVSNPSGLFRMGTAFLRGSLYIAWYRMTGADVKIGFPLMAYSKLHISGPGRVRIGKGCSVFENVFKGASIITGSRSASVTIGGGCALGGITINCQESSVTIGDRSMTAVCYVTDSFFMNPASVRSLARPSIPTYSDISLGANVWLGANSVILGGSKVGKDSVLSAGACCHNASFGEYCLVGGSPALRSFPIEQLLRFKKP